MFMVRNWSGVMNEFKRNFILARQSTAPTRSVRALPSGWKQALDQSARDVAERNFVDFEESQKAAEKDFEDYFSRLEAGYKPGESGERLIAD
jgi:hypothetical protein